LQFIYEQTTGLYTPVLLRTCKNTLSLHKAFYTNVNNFVATDVVMKPTHA